jgi:hypothetical protein
MSTSVSLHPEQANGFVGVTVAGVDVSEAVDRVVVDLGRNRMPVMQLALRADQVDGELAAYLAGFRADAERDQEAAEQIRQDLIGELQQIDPTELEEAALARVGLAGDVATVGQAFLRELIERITA